MAERHDSDPLSKQDRVPHWLLLILGAVAGCLIANLYYAQPLVIAISRNLSIAPQLAGSIVSLTQIGYGCGMVLVVPLSDLIENKRLVLSAMTGVLAALVLLVTAATPALFAAAAVLLGLCCSAAQVIIPFVAHLVEGPRQGRAVATTMAIVLGAVTLARPAALLLSDFGGWRAIFIASAVLVFCLGLVLLVLMPRREPVGRNGAVQNLISLGTVFRAEPILRRRALYQACMFGAFNIYWVAVPMALSRSFDLSSQGIAAFALVGAAGAFVAPFAARLAEAGRMASGTLVACLLFAAAFLLSNIAIGAHALFAFGFLALVADAAFHTSQTFGRLVALDVSPAVRGRANSLYMTILFSGGAVGSLVGGFSFDRAGWLGASIIGATLASFVALLTWVERNAVRAKQADCAERTSVEG
ncbi:MFS transporter [Novosphingobium mathurense]|uniref:Predicted arabinose efflux permease, MFS family n=1 Tax=Novosphingobium mathurense TaxID=428990 RepID=A0A1U6IJF7_9SPHN|nr:MFS transporter [Novosphingobium mathurense]SLK08146.1 Predicted arabinose efflux permease, MFS family [Novosphingobium mathurense]